MNIEDDGVVEILRLITLPATDFGVVTKNGSFIGNPLEIMSM